MAKEYMAQSITAISKYYATKDQEKDFIHVITNEEELTEEEILRKKFEYLKPLSQIF